MTLTNLRRRAGSYLLPPSLLALSVGACTSVPVMRPPATPLERGLFLAEAAEDGRHGISNPDPASREVVRIVEPAFVDEDSRVEVQVDAAAIAADIRLEGTALQALEVLSARSVALTGRIRTLAELVRKQAEAARAYEDLLLSDPMARELALTALLRVQEQFELMAASPGADAASIQADLAQFERDLRAEAARSGFTVRMESFLFSPGRDPVALHLEGFDLLRQGELMRRDRFGLFLAGEGLLSFQHLADQSQEQAAAVAQYLDERGDLDAAQRSLSTLVVSEYAQLGADATVLARELGADALAARAETSQGALRAFLAQLSGEAQARLQPAVNSLGSRLAETSARAGTSGLGPQLAAAANACGRARKAAASGQLSGLGGGIAEALLDAQLAAKTLALSGLVVGVEEALDGLTGELRESIRASWGSSAALLELRGWEDLYARTLALSERAANLTLSVSIHEIPPVLRVPDTLEVPSDRIPPTEFDLSLSSRQLGDRIVLRSTLMQDGKAVGDPAESHFRVSRFGWHTDTSPSVVLARSMERAPGSSNFSFVPAVSWLHTYLPRPEEKGWAAATMRTFQPSIGLHAALLNFSTDVEIEIGLGLDVGLWNGILQAGIGYNLMSDSESGREYLFIGSSLIPLVQAAQQGFTSLMR